MAVLLCAATTAEIEPTIRFLEARNLSKEVEVVITDVGLLQATYAITKAATFLKPHIMIQAGVAGCFDEWIELGTTMVVLRETVGDMGVTQNGTFTSAFAMGLLKATEKPWTDGTLTNPHDDLIKSAEFVLADSVTVNEISTDENRISYYKNGLGATVESMEGAALHYVGLLENIPFLQLRTVCNYVGERDKAAWRMQPAIDNLNQALQTILLNQIRK